MVVKKAAPAQRRAVLEVPLEDFNESISLMVYAFPGMGKTVLAGMAPNAVFVASEPGVIAAKRAGSKAGFCRIRQSADAWTWLRDAQNGKYDHREWAIIDTLTMLQNKIMRTTLDAAHARKPERDLDLPDRPEHQKVQNELKRWVEQVVDLPINKIFLAHAMRVEDEDGGAMMIPSIQGGADKGYTIANYCMALMNSVGYLQVVNLKDRGQVHRIRWQPYHDPKKDMLIQAKDQFNVFGKFTDDKTMPELIEMINAPVKPTRKARTSG